MAFTILFSKRYQFACRVALCVRMQNGVSIWSECDLAETLSHASLGILAFLLTMCMMEGNPPLPNPTPAELHTRPSTITCSAKSPRNGSAFSIGRFPANLQRATSWPRKLKPRSADPLFCSCDFLLVPSVHSGTFLFASRDHLPHPLFASLPLNKRCHFCTYPSFSRFRIPRDLECLGVVCETKAERLASLFFSGEAQDRRVAVQRPALENPLALDPSWSP